MTAPVSLRGRVIAELEHGPASIAGLSERLDVDRDALRDELRRLADAGLIRSTTRGWKLRPSPLLPRRTAPCT